MPLYKAEYFTNALDEPSIEVKRRDNANAFYELKINPKNLKDGEYYSFSKFKQDENYYQGKLIEIKNYGPDGDNELKISDKLGSQRWGMFVTDPTTNQPQKQGEFTDSNNNTKYVYNVYGDYRNPYTISVRQRFDVTFNPNGGEWKSVAQGEEKKDLVYPIAHSKKIGEAFGPFPAITVPTANNIKAPVAADGTQSNFIGWNTDKKANTGLDLSNMTITDDTTFYAIYSQQGDGYVSIKYQDLNGNDIDAKFRAEEEAKYPTEKKGDLNVAVDSNDFTVANAPKFNGYKISRVDIDNQATYTKEKTYNVVYKYEKLKDIIPDDTPDTDDDKPEGYVTVKFLAGENGTLEGKTKFYVNPKADPVKTMAEITQPTIKANTGYKVADTKWKDASDAALDTNTQITTDLTYTAQYDKHEDIINGGGNEKPDGYVTVRFLTNQNGTLEGETTYYVNPKANKTMNDITAPTITPKDGYKISTETAKQWEPNLDKKKAITEDLFYVANYESVSKVEIAYVSMDTDMGTVSHGKEEVKAGTELTGSTATAKTGYEFVNWVTPDGTEVSTEKTFKPTSRDAAIYIAKFKKTDETLGKIKVKYLDENGEDITADKRVGGGEYLTEKEGKLGTVVDKTEFIKIAPKFEGYVLDKFAYSTKTSRYTADGRNTVKYYYYKRVTTEDKTNNSRYFKVVFDANDGEFNAEPKNQKDVYVYSNAKAIENNVQISFKEVREELEKVYDKPVKTGENFIDWKDMKTGGTKVADSKIIEKPSDNSIETFYASYAKAGAYVSYRDLDGNVIDTTNFKVEGQEYPTEKAGTAGEQIPSDVYTDETAPKLIGYKFNRIELNPANAKYAIDNKATIKIYYEKLDDVIPDKTPDDDTDKPEGYVTVKFLADDAAHKGDQARGTLTGETKFYVNPKAGKTNADLTEPTIKAKTGFTVANPKWNPEFVTTAAITADATYTAQYTDGKDVIPVPDPSNPPDKPEGYVTVKFDLDGKGTTTDTKEFYVNPNKEVEITAPTVTGIGNYKQKTDDDAWSPKFVTKAKYDKDKTFVAQYTFDKDVVPQGTGEDKPVVPDNYKKVEFKEGEHGVISASQTTIFWVNPEKEVELTAPAVTANADYKHTAWKYNVNSQDKTTRGDNATKTVKDTFAADTDITAQYKKKVVDTDPRDKDYVKVDFKAETHGKIKDDEKAEFWVLKDETVEIKTPAVEPHANYAFEKWNPAVQTSYSENKTHNAVFVYTGDDVVPQPGNDKPDVPDNFVEVVFEQGTNGTIANTETVTYWVNPAKEVTVTAPTVTANEGYKHVAWTYGTKEETNLQSVTDTFTEKKTTITAKYLKKVLEEEPQTDKDAYVKVTFKAETNGKLPEGKAEKSYWVLKDTPVSLTEPTVTANPGWKFIKYEPAVKTSYSEVTEHKAQYKKIIVTEDPKDKDYVKVTFDPAAQGTIKAGSNAEVWVLKDETIDPKDITPELEVKEKYAFKEWTPAVQTSYSADTKHTATYTYNGDDVVPQKPGEDKPNVPDDFVKVTFVAGDHGSIANTETYIYWVNPEKPVTLNAPTVTADKDWKHVAWTYKVNDTEKTTSGPTALTTVIDTFTSKETTITAKYKEKVVTEDPNDTDYVKVTFKAEANGKLAGDKKETAVWVLKNTDVKVDAPEVTPNKGYTFTEWSPAVKTIYDKDTTHTAQYKEKDKVVTEDPNDKDYIKVTFNANGGKIGTEDTKDVWVLNGIATFADAKAKVATPTKDKATFKEWQDVYKNGKAVADNKVLSTESETFYAAYTDNDKIIEDPTTPQPKPGYVRLTFDATADGKIGKNQEKYIDVLEGTKYEDTDLQDVVKKIKPTYKDNTKVFENWSPEFPNEDKAVETSTYTATYKDATKIIDKDPTTPGEIDDKYIRFVFDANTKDNPAKTGKIGQNQKYIFDVLKGTRFSDSDLQKKINKIVPVADDTKLKFNVWDPSVLKDNTLVENATAANGMSADGKTITYNATYKDKDADIVPGDQDKPDGYVTVRFLTNKNGTLTGETTYYVNPEAGKKMSEITLPTITANDGYKVATPNWKPDFTNDTSEIKEDRNYVANYDSENPSPTKFEINYISIDTTMGTVDPASEEVAIDKAATNGTIQGSTAKAIDGYEFVKWIDDEGNKITEGITTTAQGTKLVPTARNSATYIAVFKEKVKETTADKVKTLYDFEGVDLAAFVGDELTADFWKDGVKKTEKAGNTLTPEEKAAINTALGNATVSDLSERNTDYEVLSPSKGTLEVKFEDGSTVTVQQKLYVYGNGSDKPADPNQPTPKDKVEVTYKAGEGVENFVDKVVIVKKGTKEADLPGKPDAKAIEGFKDLKWTAEPAIDATNGIQADTSVTASAVTDHDYAKTTFTVNKIWPNDVNDVPTIKFTLYRKVEDGQEEAVQGAEVKTITKDLTTATWDNIAKTNSEGKTYTYSVKETFAEKDPKNDNWILGKMETYGKGNNTITNKLKTVPGTGENPEDDKNFVGKLTITKKLENEPVVQAQTNGMRRAPKQALKFSFKVTGPYGYEKTFELTAGESKTLENLAYGDYTVVETDSKGYTPEYSKAKETLTKDSPNGSITVTNKNKESTDPQNPNENIIDVTVKKVWKNAPQGTTTPQVKIELWRKGYDLNDKEFEQKVGEFTTAANKTENKFIDLAKQDPSGKDFTYYAVEPTVPGNYTASYSDDNLTVTNTYKAPEKEYTVTYDKGDATTGTMNPVKVAENTDYTILGNGFNYADHDFTGWKIDGTNEIKQPGDVIKITKDVKLVAQWKETETPEPAPTNFTIKYISMDTEKGTVSSASETVAITGGTIAGSTATATTGNKFVKWMDTDGNTKSTDANFVPTERKDATYIAVFEADTSVTPDPEPTEFTIKYVSTDTTKGTVSSATETVAITGGTITGSTATATTGNKFVKWIDTDGNTKSTDANFVPTERKDATYIAVFEADTSVTPDPEPTEFTIKYVSTDTTKGTVSSATETVAITGGTITGSTATATTGNKFVKWIDTDGNTKSTEANFVPTERKDATYIAVFEKIGSVTPPEPWPPTPGPDPRPNPDPWPPYRPHRPDPRPDDRYDRDDRDDTTITKPEDARPVLDHEAYMFGYTDSTVRPNGNITRAEAAALVTRLLGIEAYASAAKPNFPDTPSAWYNKAINAAVERGIMKGYPDGRFRPNAPITRAEFTQMISTIDNKPYGVAPFADVVGHWAERPIGSEYQAGRIAGYPDGLFRPNAYITRCEAVVILNKIFERNYDELSAINAMNKEKIKVFIDLTTSFWGYNDMVEATNSHSFKRRVEGRIEEDWVLVK